MHIYACIREITEAWMKVDNTTNRAEWRTKLFSYLPATPDDGASQGRKRRNNMCSSKLMKPLFAAFDRGLRLEWAYRRRGRLGKGVGHLAHV